MPSELKLAGLDNKDRRIMYELELNSRQPVSAIAKKLRIDKAVVNYRINRLIKQKYILGSYTVIDALRLGYKGISIHLSFEHTDEKKEKEIIDFFVNHELTWWVAGVVGGVDLVVDMWARDVYEFKEFWIDFNNRYGKYVQEKDIRVFIEIYESPYAFLSPTEVKDKPMTVMSGKETVNISKAERKVLKVIANDSRMPTTMIAKKTELTPIQVKYAIRKLQKKGVIKAFRIVLNRQKLQMGHYEIDLSLRDFSLFDKLLEFVRAHPNIIYADNVIGGSDFSIEIIAKGDKQLHDIIHELKKRFPKVITSFKYRAYSDRYKLQFF